MIGGRPTDATRAFPRYFRFGRYPVNAYKVFLCVGIYLGIMASAAVGAGSGISPLQLGTGLLLFAIVGMAGARVYHLAAHAGDDREVGITFRPRNADEGGWSVLGGLIVVPISLLFGSIAGIPTAVFWDHMAIAIAVGGMWIRFGCVCNGCCVGRDSDGWFALDQHDVNGITRRRIPAQWLEIAWWGLACAGLAWMWPRRLPPGSYALGLLAWYGAGRFWLEPLRRTRTFVHRIDVNRAVAGALAVVACAWLTWRLG